MPFPWAAAIPGGIGLLASLFGRPGEESYQHQTAPWMQAIWDELQKLPQPDVERRMMSLLTPSIGREQARTAERIGGMATRGGYSGSPAHSAILARLGTGTQRALGEAGTRAGLAQGEAEANQRRFRLATLSNLASGQQQTMDQARLLNWQNRVGRQQYWPQFGAGMMGLGGNILAGYLGRPDMGWLKDLLEKYQTQGGGTSPLGDYPIWG